MGDLDLQITKPELNALGADVAKRAEKHIGERLRKL